MPVSDGAKLCVGEKMNTGLVMNGEERARVELSQPQWYALYVRCNHEKTVSRSLAGRGVEHFLPCYESVRQWKDRRMKLEMPLFPGYLFVRAPLQERTIILSVPNVVLLVGTAKGPSPISEQEIDWIRRGIEHGAEPHKYLRTGQRVLITEGAMAGLEGILVSRRNRSRIVVALDSIARAFVIEVDAWQVEGLPISRKGVHAGTAGTATPFWNQSRPSANVGLEKYKLNSAV